MKKAAFITKTKTYQPPLIPTDETIRAIEESRAEVARGETGPVFTNAKDFIKYLNRL